MIFIHFICEFFIFFFYFFFTYLCFPYRLINEEFYYISETNYKGIEIHSLVWQQFQIPKQQQKKKELERDIDTVFDS